MPTALTSDRPQQPDDGQEPHHPLDVIVPVPTDLAPLCDEAEFAAILESMVADEAPRLFAIVQEYGERADARIAAWGMAFDDHAEVVSQVSGMRASLRAPEHALRRFNLGSHIRARLVWFNADAVTSAEGDQAL